MPRPLTIAIDGPAASGKSTVGELLARRLGYLYFDTGVMYRAVTWAALEQHIAISDENALTTLAETLHIQVCPPTVLDGRQYTVLADDQDITWDIRRPEVNQHVSPVSAYPGVRRALTAQQRRIGLRGQVIMVGRDIGTVVLPQADLKLYIEACLDERARRRHIEVLRRRGDDPAHADPQEYDEIRQSMMRRDQIDSERATSPLRPAADAVIIDTTHLTIEQVLDYIGEIIDERERSTT